MPIRSAVEQLTNTRNKLIYHSIMGEYKDYVATRKDYAKQCIRYPEEIKYIPPATERFGIFSKYGRNIIKTWFKEIFRLKTPEERLMVELFNEIKAREKSGWKA